MGVDYCLTRTKWKATTPDEKTSKTYKKAGHILAVV
jgi:hypothetical protein